MQPTEWRLWYRPDFPPFRPVRTGGACGKRPATATESNRPATVRWVLGGDGMPGERDHYSEGIGGQGPDGTSGQGPEGNGDRGPGETIGRGPGEPDEEVPGGQSEGPPQRGGRPAVQRGQAPATEPGAMVAGRRQVSAAGLPPLRCRLAPPALPVPHVPRPRLWELLEAGDRALTIVRGPAGCGKTALLASWYLARRDGQPLVWLQVDPATGPPPTPAGATAAPVRVSFWAHLLAALRSHPDADPTGALARLRPPAPGGRADLFCRELTDALAVGRPLPLVAIIDDVGLIQDPADIAGLELLAQGAAGLRLVLSGRRIPVAAHRARAAGQLIEIGPDLLAFDPAETDRLLAALRVPAAAATGLRAATEGWAAGLRLAAAALTTAADVAAVAAGLASARAQDSTSVAHGRVGEGATAAGAGGAGQPTLPPAAFAPVADYLRAEALATMPAGLRRLLLRTSVLDEVCGPLAEAVAAEPAAGDRLLAELATGAVLATPLLGSPLATPLPAGRLGVADGGLAVDRGLGGGLGVEVNLGLGGDWGRRLGQASGPRQETEVRGAGGKDGPAGGEAAPGEGPSIAAVSWYRYHALLRAVLRDTLRRDPAEDEAELNLRAALWYAANRRLVDAARHAREAADWRYLACLVARGPVPLLLQGELPDLAALLEYFPDRAAGLGPECAVTAAAARVLAGDAVTAGEYLELARSGLAAATSADGQAGAAARPGPRGAQAAMDGSGSPGAARRVLLTAIEAVELRRAELTGDVDAALATARRALRVRAMAEPGPAAGLPDGLRPLALAARGRAELWRGRLEAAQDALGVALADTRRAGFTGATAGCLGALALGFALRGRLRQAEETAAAALAAGRPREVTWPDGLARADATSCGAEHDDIARGRDPDGGFDSWVAVVGPSGAGREPVDGLVSLTTPATASGGAGVPGTAEALLALAVVAGHRGDSAVGLGWADLAGRAAGESGQLPGLVSLLRAWLRLGRRTGEDLRAARRALAAFPAREAPALLAAVREATQADLLVAGGNPDAALRLLGPDETASRRDRPAARLARGRAHLARGDAAAAAVSVAPLLRADGGGSASVVGACAISAVAAARQGDGAQAGGLLARAFALAQDEQLVRPFVELGPEIVALIDAHPGLPDAAPRLVTAVRRAVAREAPRRPNERPRTSEHLRPGEQGRLGQPRPVSRGERAGTGPARGTTRPQAGPHPVTVPTARRAARPVVAHPDAALGHDGPARWEAGEEVRGAGPRGGLVAGRPGPADRVTPGGRPGTPPRGSSLAGGTMGGGSPVLGGGHVGGGHAAGGSAAADGSAMIDRRDDAARGPFPPGVERAPRQPAGRGADRLSDRELAVLSYLPTMLTTAEIAAKLYVSVNTVKTHLKSIYRKLDVARRRDAVHRARALHLL